MIEKIKAKLDEYTNSIISKETITIDEAKFILDYHQALVYERDKKSSDEYLESLKALVDLDNKKED